MLQGHVLPLVQRDVVDGPITGVTPTERTVQRTNLDLQTASGAFLHPVGVKPR